MLKPLILCCGVIAASAFVSSCEELSCTLIGCTDQIMLRVTRSNTVDSVAVRVLAAGAELTTFKCGGTSECLGVVAGTPASITVEVTVRGSTTRRDITPQYIISQPNGIECPPTCKQATVEITA